jgi:hypothetical protein
MHTAEMERLRKMVRDLKAGAKPGGAGVTFAQEICQVVLFESVPIKAWQ